MRETETNSPRAKVWISLITTTFGVLASLISAIINSAEIIQFSKAIIAAVFGIFITATFTLFLARGERGSSKITKLKSELISKYMECLDRSSLNPSREGFK